MGLTNDYIAQMREKRSLTGHRFWHGRGTLLAWKGKNSIFQLRLTIIKFYAFSICSFIWNNI